MMVHKNKPNYYVRYDTGETKTFGYKYKLRENSSEFQNLEPEFKSFYLVSFVRHLGMIKTVKELVTYRVSSEAGGS